MFRAPKTWMLASSLLLAGALPSAAQNRLALVEKTSQPAQRVVVARLEFAPQLAAQANDERLARPAAQLAAPARSEPLFATAVPAGEPNRGATLESSFRYEETPFSQRLQLPVARLLNGRIQLRGFDTLESTENAVWGPPGSLPAWSVTTQAHPGVWAPRSSESFGVSLSIRLTGDAGEGRSVQLLHCLGWLVGAGRGCRLL
jgi:hypothetical protein